MPNQNSDQKLSSAHGVMLSINGTGVLITGESGIGKSELALELIKRGAKLVADDSPLFKNDNGQLIALTPARMQGMLAIRDIGIIDLKQHIGSEAIADSATVNLIIELTHGIPIEVTEITARTMSLLGLSVPHYTLTINPNRDLALLTQTLIRQHLLQLAGSDSTKTWLLGQQLEING